LGIERCGKRNASNSGAESWTGIGGVAGCAAIVFIVEGPHVSKGVRLRESNYLRYYRRLGLFKKLATS
jgi:hypothetical protein